LAALPLSAVAGPAEWARLGRRVGGRLVPVTSPVAACPPDPASPGCTELLQNLRDPCSLGDRVALTQTLGWTDAWTSQASAYAVLAQPSADVAAAVHLARQHRVRLVVKGGGHRYGGGSNATDSLRLVLGGGFGSFSKGFGTAAADLAGGRGRHRRRGHPHRQPGQEPGAVLGPHALAIAAANEPPAYPGIGGHEPDVARGRRDAGAAAMAPLKALAERPACYLSETDSLQDDWQASFWGDHSPGRTRVKDRDDPGGLFSVPHGVGTQP
jgi:hypothetical protein